MDYKFLASKQMEKFFEETDFSVGDIFRTIFSKSLTGLNIQNKSRFQEISDQEWYIIIEKSLTDCLEDDPTIKDEEWGNVINKMFKNERK